MQVCYKVNGKIYWWMIRVQIEYCKKLLTLLQPQTTMKPNYLIFLILILLTNSFLITKSSYCQPWPDNNFCEVSAKLVFSDSVCVVGGHAPLEFKWDDGTVENMMSWVIPGGMVAVKY